MASDRMKKTSAPSRRSTTRERKKNGSASSGAETTVNGSAGDLSTNGHRVPSPEEIAQEDLRSRRLQRTMDLCLALIEQTRGLTVGESIEIILEARSVALTLFPGSEAMFDLLYKPRLMRAVRERFGIEEVPDVPGDAPSGA